MEIRNKTILHIIIFSIAFLIFVNIWPLENIKLHKKSNLDSTVVNNILQTSEDKVIIHVVFQEDHIENIEQYIDVEQYNELDRVTFRLLDENFKPIYQELIRCELLERDKKVKIHVNTDVVPGQNYFYEWMIYQVNEDKLPTTLKLPLVSRANMTQSETMAMYINDAGTLDYAFATNYDYASTFAAWQIALIAVLLILAQQIVYQLIVWLIDKLNLSNISEAAVKRMKYALVLVIAAFSLVAIILSVAVNIWDGNLDDRIVYAIGIVTAAIWAINGIIDNSQEEQKKNQNQILIWKNYIQIVCIGMAIYSACRYVNAEYELIHTINTRRIITYLLIAFAMIPNKKNLPDYRIWKNLNLPMLGLWAILMIIMNVYKEKMTWPPVLLLFGIPFLFRMTKAGQKRLLNNFSWGVYVSFFITTGYCLLHRPYNKWIYYRYTGMFHTVAYTGMYLSMVVAVSLARYISKKRKLDLFMFATSFGYVLLSMTRTAMLSIGVAGIVAVIMMIFNNKENLLIVSKRIGTAIAIVITSFCMVFSATRMIPAIVNEPIYMDIENTESFGIGMGEKIDSSRYMRFNRYIEIMFGRFGHEKSEEAKLDTTVEASSLLVSVNPLFIPASAASQVNDSVLKNDLSNGRIDIFKAYIANIGWEHHDKFSCIYEDTEYAHAHNAPLQIAYLFGLFGGIVFVILCIYTWIESIIHFVNNKSDINSLVPFMVVTIFGITSCIEWTYQPGIPIGLCFMFIQMFLIKRAVEGKPKK